MKQFDKVGALHRSQRFECAGCGLIVSSQDHVLHKRESLAKKHVLGAAQADTFGAQRAGLGGICGAVCVGSNADLVTADLVGPAKQRVESVAATSSVGAKIAQKDLTRGAVDRNHVASSNRFVTDVHKPVAERQHVCTTHSGDTPAPSYDRGMAGSATLGGDDALGHTHGDFIGWRCFGRGQDHGFAPISAIETPVDVEVDLAYRRARRRANASGYCCAAAVELCVQRCLDCRR